MPDLNIATAAALLGTVLTSGWLGSVLVEFMKGRAGRRVALETAQVGREGQLDDLTFELITAAKTDIKELRAELAILRPMQTHLLHFEEAIAHLEAMLRARHDPPALENAANAASTFLLRIARAREAIGNIRQETQVLRSEEQLARNRAAERDQAKGGGE